MKKESKKAAFRAGSLGVAWLLGYTEGREAHRRGISSRANPFEPCSSLGVAWLLGYTESWESQTECAGATVARGGRE